MADSHNFDLPPGRHAAAAGNSSPKAVPMNENTGPERSVDNSRIVAKNAAWSSVEVVFGLIANFFTSVVIARVIGRDAAGQARLGSYQYIVWLTTITLTMGSFGLPATTRKYMAEYLNNGRPEIARATYLSTLKIQSYLSLGAAVAGFLVVYWLGDPQYFVTSILLVLAIVPRLIATVPSQANNAAEMVRRNATPGVAGVAVTSIVTIMSLVLGWSFVGLAAAVLAGASLECGLKLRGVERWMRGISRGVVAPELRKRMLTYSSQGMVLLLLNLVVWDRSDIMILKMFNPDTRQIVFFSLPFSLVERVLLLPSLFAGALGFTMMAQYGRGGARLKDMTVDGGRYALMVALPLLVGLACISQPLILLLYTGSYRQMIPTLTIIALLAVPKALVTAPTMLLQVTERQGFLIFWGCVCGAIDIGLDLFLVGRHGANGAAIANGTAQTMAALGIWIYARKVERLDLRLGDCGRVLISGALMCSGVLTIITFTPGKMGLFLSILCGAALWVLGLRLTAAVRKQDASRFVSIGKQFPAALQPLWRGVIAWVTPESASQV